MISKIIARVVIGAIWVFSSASSAHLMVAEHGTLNFDDSGAYMVISVPALSFAEADIDNSGSLSVSEFKAKKDQIILAILDKVWMTQNERKKPLQGIMVSPQVAHHGNRDHIDQIVVMGKFIDVDHRQNLMFHSSLFGSDGEQKLAITAKFKRLGIKQKFVLTPQQINAKVF
ncbi:hypothetical protein N474_11595 [Pseudoalteromonas luteoviolacea CPMOR-2]|uniref:hypothetical protein n=1 Tax=Pseudoalteromonas luteoviolacea TaxID=43657 RepID=UPI0007B0ADAA|nr:hypothetical protein [Pseudoalteromonas luteoviolacea]KZN56382.1 hypothetical protein N474_11595 [Pseudoalteromonas luteoviolacea CPMOR-2]